jgi:hypothetical protein
MLYKIFLVLLFGAFFISCDNDDSDDEKNKPVTSPLYNIEFHSAIELGDSKIEHLNSSADDDGFGYFGLGSNKRVNSGYFGIKDDDGKWYETVRLGPYWYFGNSENLGKKMERWEYAEKKLSPTLSQFTPIRRDTRSFKYINNEEIEIGGIVYKFKLGDMRGDTYQYDNETLRIRLQLLKIYYEGIENQPTILMCADTILVK